MQKLFNEADTDFSARDAAGDTGSPDAQSGTNPATLNDSPSAGTYTTGSGMTTAQAETLGDVQMSLQKWLSQSIKSL